MKKYEAMNITGVTPESGIHIELVLADYRLTLGEAVELCRKFGATLELGTVQSDDSWTVAYRVTPDGALPFVGR